MSRKSAYEFLGVDQLIGYTDIDQHLSQTQLEKFELAIGTFNKEIKPIAEDISHISKNKMRVVFCLDFDVVRSASRWLDEADSNSFWSYMVVDFNKDSIEVLPGTLYEIDKYLKEDSIENKDLNYNNNMSAKLSDALLNSDLKILSDTNFISPFANFIRQSVTNNERQFVLRLMFEKIIRKPKKYKLPDHKIYNRVNNILKANARIDKILANKADALNYSIAHSLNSISNQTNTKYVLVSNTKLMHEADRSITGFDGEQIVWTPRRAAIFQLLLLNRKDLGGPELHVWNLRQTLESSQKKLVEVRTRREKLTIRQLNGNDIFIKMMSLLYDLQNRIDFASNRKRLEFLKKDYFDLGAEKFYSEVTQFISQQLKKAGIERYVPKTESDFIPKMKIEKCEADKRYTYTQLNRLATNSGETICYHAEYDRYDTVHLNNSLADKFPILWFEEIINQVIEGVYGKVLDNIYKVDKSIVEGKLHISRPITIIFKDGELWTGQFDGKLDLVELLQPVNNNVDNIAFIRVDAVLFTASFEGDVCAIKYSSDVQDEVRGFVSDIFNILSGGKHLDHSNKVFSERFLKRTKKRKELPSA